MTRFITLLVLFCLAPLLMYAQQQTVYKVSVQTNYTPGYRLNYSSYDGASSVSFKLSAYNIEVVPFEMGVYISTVYHANASVSYGLSFAYLYPANKNILLKAGISGGRIKMDKYRSNVEVGGVLADDYHKTVQPFVALEWLFTDHFSLYLQSGYRLLFSETSRVTEILKRGEYGFPIAYKTTTPLGQYGAGFQFSVGLSVGIE